jgi:CHAT domain-containing protein
LNQAEVDSIQRLIGGSVLEGAAATEEAFLSEAPDYQILHLATHGYGDRLTGDNSYLAFTETPNGKEDEILFARELYNQQFNADLVVLSACETSMGQLQRGEGIISLARGFSFAGAKSIVTSLWTVRERPTVALLQQFYKRLVKDGHSKDEALWKAKLKLLSGEFQEPYYWAAFVPVGDMEAIVGPKNGSALPWWVLITAIVAVLFVFGLWRRNKAG